MSEPSAPRRVIVRSDAAAVASHVAARLLERLAFVTAHGAGPIHLSLTGGGVGSATLREVAVGAAGTAIDWSRVHLWWSDERFVARGSAERNDVAADAALIGQVPIPPAQVHRIAGSDEACSPEAAATDYQRQLAEYGTELQPWPSFEVCLLGVGPDAHIASLFPDRPEVRITDRSAVAVHDSPKPPPVRVSLTRPVINSSQAIWLCLAGPDKASALGLALAGASYASVPAAGVKGRRETLFFVDEAAAAEVPGDLISQA